MKDLIERYIYDVTRRLPESQREEVSKELRANIEDMLPENYNIEDVKKVLLTLGEPRKLANNYRQKPRYLISPEWMDEYLRVLKIVAIVFAAVSLVSGMVEAMLHPEATTAIGIFAEVLSVTIANIIQGLVSAFAIVTLIFVGIEAYGKSGKKEAWALEKLPHLPTVVETKISRTGSFIGLIFTTIFGILFIYYLMNHDTYIGWYEDRGQWTMIIPLFNDSVISLFIPFMILSLVVSVISQIVKLRYGVWNIQVAAVHTISQILSVSIFAAFIINADLINPEIFAQAAVLFHGNAAEYASIFTDAAIGFSAFLGFVVAIDIIVTWVKKVRIDKKAIN